MIWQMIQDMGMARRGDLHSLQKTVRSHRRSARAHQTRIDRAQNERIQELEAEVRELRVDLAAALSLLIGKGLIEPEECRVIASETETAEPDADEA